MDFSYQYDQSESITNMSEWTSSHVHVTEVEIVPKLGMAQGIIGVVLNTLAWLVILRTKNLHNMTNYLLAYLAVTDSICCFSVVVYYSSTTWWFNDKGFVQFMTGLVSSFGLCMVTYERYIGIAHPLHYPSRITLKKVTVIAFLSWILSFLVLCPTLLIALYSSTASEVYIHTVFLLFGYLFPILFMCWAYYKIQATLKRSAQQLRQQNVQGAALELLQARQNVISMLRIVMGALVVLWTPLVVWLMFCSILKDLCGSNNADVITLLVLVAMYNMNSVINPIIYVFKYKKFRKGLQDMLCSCIGRPLRPNRIEVQIDMNERTA